MISLVHAPQSRCPFYWHGLTLILGWVSNHIHYKVSYEIIYPFPNFQQRRRWSLGMDKFFYPTLCWSCNYLSILGLYFIYVSKRYARVLFKYKKHLSRWLASLIGYCHETTFWDSYMWKDGLFIRTGINNQLTSCQWWSGRPLLSMR